MKTYDYSRDVSLGYQAGLAATKAFQLLNEDNYTNVISVKGDILNDEAIRLTCTYKRKDFELIIALQNKELSDVDEFMLADSVENAVKAHHKEMLDKIIFYSIGEEF